MAPRAGMPCVSLVAKRGTKAPASVRRNRFRRSRLLRREETAGATGPVTPVKAFPGSRPIAPLLLRRSQIRFRWHLLEERWSARVAPESSALHLEYWETPWSNAEENAATVLQAQWRMCLARHQFRSVQNAVVTIQRRWRESRRLTYSAMDIVGIDGQRSMDMPGLLVGRHYDTDMSAIQEEEIFDEFLSFLPCPEHDVSDKEFDASSCGNREPHVVSDSSSLPDSSIAVKNDISLLCTYEACNLDSPAKELTFARMSIDGSLPPTPIKEWSSRKREPARRASAAPVVWNSNVVELHHSPTKDWASPLPSGRKSAIFRVSSPSAGERFQLPTEWFTDLDEFEVTSVSFSPSSDDGLLSPDRVCSSRALICIPEQSGSPSHQDLVVKSPVSVKRTACSSPKSIDLSRWRDTTIAEEDIGSFSLTPSATHGPTDVSSDSPLAPALEEELLDELTKLFQGSPDPAVGSSVATTSWSLAHDPIRGSYSKSLSRVCNGALGNDGFLVHSARKLDFSFDEPEDHGERCQQNEHHVEADGRTLSPPSMSRTLAPIEPAISLLPEADDGNGLVLDGVTASRDSRSYSKRCQSTVTDFLQLVEQNLDTGADHSERNSGSAPAVSPYASPSPVTQLLTIQDEDDFCDKAVDGNVVVVKEATHVGRDAFHSSKVAASMESPSRSIEKPAECVSVDRYETFRCADHSSSFVTPKVSKPSLAMTRSCGAITRSKPPMPMKSRRTSFDQIIYKSDEPFTPADERKFVLPEKKVSARLLYNSPASPGTQLGSFSPALPSAERSSALSVSKKYFLQSPSSRLHSEKCDSDTESVASPKNSQPLKMESSLDGSEKKSSARALFSCEEPAMVETSDDGAVKPATEWSDASHYSCFEDNYEAILKQRDHHRLWFPGDLSGPLLLTNGAESADCSFRKSTASAWDCGLMTLLMDGGLMNVESSSPSLHDLCKVWDEEYMDLLTRSLKYKNLMTDPNLLRHEVKMAFEKPEPFNQQSVAWEIQNIEKLKEKLESRETLKELIQQQRDTVYVNIATNASMRERYRLYSKWGIRRMSRGRLRKVIYELLWKDPKRFHASADLVLQYL